MFSSSGLDLAFKIWWHHKPYLAIVWRHDVINFDWKCCFKSSSRKNVNYKRFHHFSLGSKQENEFLSSDDAIKTSQAPRPKVQLGTDSFLLCDI